MFRSSRVKNRFVMFNLALVFIFTSSCTNFNTKHANVESQRNVAQITPEIPLNQPWSYDPGPDANTAMGRELIDIVATQPNMPGISKEMTGSQKFRPAFGPTLWRMIQKPNSVKILFIGQDGTHIAEAAGRTATAGFGGRAQDLAYHFGVMASSAYMNTFAFTIYGQYTAFGVPVISEYNGKKQVSFDSVTDNGIWMISQDLNSPMVKWRNRLIDWIIRNNKDTLKLVVLFGGAAQDAIGTYIESAGGKVGSRYSKEQLIAQKVQVPFFKSESGAANKESPVALTKKNEDVFASLSVNIPYKDLGSMNAEKAKYAETKLLEGKTKFTNGIDSMYPNLAISNGGIGNSGVVHPAQIGGYDLRKININGQTTISLKNLKLTDGTTITNDILVAEFPHPTSLSASEMSNKGSASVKVGKSLEALLPMKAKGWAIEPDPGLENRFTSNKPYVYGRTDIPPDFYDFGTPNNRMVSVSSASRMSGNPNIVVIGTRDRATFDMNKLSAATNVGRPAGIAEDELYTARPRGKVDRYLFDMGPGEKMARIMKENLDMKAISTMKPQYVKANPGVKPYKAGIEAFNVKSHPFDVGDFGHYRGTFVDPQVVVLADPDGLDDILTARALTGARGQYLQTLFNQLGVNDKYLVIKTVPFSMDGATDQEWKRVIYQTLNYREKIFEEVLKNRSIKMIIADGKWASLIMPKLNKTKIPVVSIKKTGSDDHSGINEAIPFINDSLVFPRLVSGVDVMSNIPRTHLGFFSRVWEGTSGTRVFGATSPADRGVAYAIVAPAWAYLQKPVIQSVDERASVEALKNSLKVLNLPMGNETYSDYMTRMSAAPVIK
jgi:hypothetical protein